MVKLNKKSNMESKGDKYFHIGVIIMMIIFAIITLYPLWFMVIASVSNPDSVLNGHVWLWPDTIDFSGYIKIFNDPQIWIGYRNTILYTLIGTALNIILTIPAGYALSRPNLPHRKYIMWFFIITMFFRWWLNSILLLNIKYGYDRYILGINHPTRFKCLEHVYG